jgi:hypothetical protein
MWPAIGSIVTSIPRERDQLNLAVDGRHRAVRREHERRVVVAIGGPALDFIGAEQQRRADLADQ